MHMFPVLHISPVIGAPATQRPVVGLQVSAARHSVAAAQVFVVPPPQVPSV